MSAKTNFDSRGGDFCFQPQAAIEFCEGFIAYSPIMLNICDKIEKTAKMNFPVLISGETGVGKEVVAKAIHHKSDRAQKPFCLIDCTTLVDSLLENELFGHERGVYTGANKSEQGLFQMANGGTIFFDEISEMPLSLQSKLLRFVEEHAFRPVGATKYITIDVRIIAATNRKLADLLNPKLMRVDLYHRLNAIHIDIPPLRERISDIMILVNYFVGLSGQGVCFDDEVVEEALLRYPWPGNIRELKHIVETTLAFRSKREVITVDDLPFEVLNFKSKEAAEVNLNLDDVCQQHINKVLEVCEGNLTRAAIALGIARSTLSAKIRRYSRR